MPTLTPLDNNTWLYSTQTPVANFFVFLQKRVSLVELAHALSVESQQMSTSFLIKGYFAQISYFSLIWNTQYRLNIIETSVQMPV